MANKRVIQAALLNFGFTQNYIDRAFLLHDKNFSGHEYDVEVMTEIIIRLQNKDKFKQNEAYSKYTSPKPKLNTEDVEHVYYSDEYGWMKYAAFPRSKSVPIVNLDDNESVNEFEDESKRTEPKRKESVRSLSTYSIPSNYIYYSPRSTTSSKTCDQVFIGIHKLYHHWPEIKSETFMSSLIILPNICIEWILNPSLFNNTSTLYNKSQTIDIDYLSDLCEIFMNKIFIEALKCKYEQKLLICNTVESVYNMYDSKKSVSVTTPWPFWNILSMKLIDLGLCPLIFVDGWYTSKLYKSQFGVSGDDIIVGFLKYTNIDINVVAEVIYQSNPSLNIITDSQSFTTTKSKFSTISPSNSNNTRKTYTNSEIYHPFPICALRKKHSNREPQDQAKKYNTASVKSDETENEHGSDSNDDISFNQSVIDSSSYDSLSNDSSRSTHCYNKKPNGTISTETSPPPPPPPLYDDETVSSTMPTPVPCNLDPEEIEPLEYVDSKSLTQCKQLQMIGE